MSCLAPSRQRTIPVRLIDVEPRVRLSAANRAIRIEPDPLERVLIKLTALYPPEDLTAWIRP